MINNNLSKINSPLYIFHTFSCKTSKIQSRSDQNSRSTSQNTPDPRPLPKISKSATKQAKKIRSRLNLTTQNPTHKSKKVTNFPKTHPLKIIKNHDSVKNQQDPQKPSKSFIKIKNFHQNRTSIYLQERD